MILLTEEEGARFAVLLMEEFIPYVYEGVYLPDLYEKLAPIVMEFSKRSDTHHQYVCEGYLRCLMSQPKVMISLVTLHENRRIKNEQNNKSGQK